MSERQVRTVLSNRLERSDFDEGCSYLTPNASGIAFMLLKSRVARVDVSGGHWLTASGAGIGTSEKQIYRLYKRVEKGASSVPRSGAGLLSPESARLRRS